LGSNIVPEDRIRDGQEGGQSGATWQYVVPEVHGKPPALVPVIRSVRPIVQIEAAVTNVLPVNQDRNARKQSGAWK
jgi:hypothetical protein